MKKYLICILAMALAFGGSAFTNLKKSSGTSNSKFFQYRWFDYYGGLFEQCDPSYFYPDENNFPDCPPALGIIFCEIRALPSPYDPTQPDLTTIVETRYRPLL